MLIVLWHWLKFILIHPPPQTELKPFNLFVDTKTNLKLLFHKFHLGQYFFLNDTERVIFGLKLTARLGGANFKFVSFRKLNLYESFKSSIPSIY